MKRALYEWLGLGFAAAAVSCAAYWVLVVCGVMPDVRFAFEGIEVATHCGSIAVGNANFLIGPQLLEAPETVQDSFASSHRLLTLPGLGVWILQYRSATMWGVKVSLLYPALSAALCGVFCYWRLRAPIRGFPATIDAASAKVR